MAFEKLGRATDGSPGETYINLDHIAEVVIQVTSWGQTEARVKYAGGAWTIFSGDAVEALREIIDPPQHQATSI